MVSPNIEELFDNNRFPGGLALFSVILYFPIGVILAILRFFIGLHTFLVACLLPKMSIIRRIVLRVMCGLLGLIVTQTGATHRDRRAKVMVSNYCTTLDHVAVGLVLPSIMPSVWDLPPFLIWMLGYADMGAKQGRDVLIQNAKKHCEDSPLPVLAFPEGASTNGKVGLLKFSTWPFSLDQHVQPVLVQVSRPLFAKISPSILGGRWWIDIFWFMFVPYTHFHIRILPSSSREEDETTEEFTMKIQQSMASHLSVAPTSHTSADKVEYAKRKLFIPPNLGTNSQRSPQSGSGMEPSTLLSPGSGHQGELDVMSQQVKEVLPHVPLSAIRTDLALTKDVDHTITNILEGRVVFSSDDSGSPTSSSSRMSQDSNPKPSVQRTNNISAAKSFSRNSKDRHLSLSERKQALVEMARKRYIEKHGTV